ncbi:tyrosine-type recombinase/integrase [Nocardiopsis sp. NPDC055824]
MDAGTVFEELTHDYLVGLKLAKRSPRTLLNYGHTLRKLGTWCRDHHPEALADPSEFTPRRIQRWLYDEAASGIAESSVLKLYIDARAFFGYVMKQDENWLTRNPVSEVPRPAADIPVVEGVSPETVRRLIAAPTRSLFHARRDEAWLRLLYDTGIRVGELRGIDTSDLNWEHGTVLVSGKTGPRTVPFGDATLVSLRKYARSRMSHPLAEQDAFFLGTRGRMAYNTIRQTLIRKCRDAGVDPVHPHRFRYGWLDSFLEDGGSVQDAMTIGGWSSPLEITRRYGVSGRERRARSAMRRHSPGNRL